MKRWIKQVNKWKIRFPIHLLEAVNSRNLYSEALTECSQLLSGSWQFNTWLWWRIFFPNWPRCWTLSAAAGGTSFVCSSAGDEMFSLGVTGHWDVWPICCYWWYKGWMNSEGLHLNSFESQLNNDQSILIYMAYIRNYNLPQGSTICTWCDILCP